MYVCMYACMRVHVCVPMCARHSQPGRVTLKQLPLFLRGKERHPQFYQGLIPVVLLLAREGLVVALPEGAFRKRDMPCSGRWRGQEP